jgi:hypothetical protein
MKHSKMAEIEEYQALTLSTTSRDPLLATCQFEFATYDTMYYYLRNSYENNEEMPLDDCEAILDPGCIY